MPEPPFAAGEKDGIDYDALSLRYWRYGRYWQYPAFLALLIIAPLTCWFLFQIGWGWIVSIVLFVLLLIIRQSRPATCASCGKPMKRSIRQVQDAQAIYRYNDFHCASCQTKFSTLRKRILLDNIR